MIAPEWLTGIESIQQQLPEKRICPFDANASSGLDRRHFTTLRQQYLRNIVRRISRSEQTFATKSTLRTKTQQDIRNLRGSSFNVYHFMRLQGFQ
jgi:hypothetical protein